MALEASVRQWLQGLFGWALITAFCSVEAYSEMRRDALYYVIGVGGIKVAEMDVVGETDGTTYQALGRMESTGLVDWFARMRYDGKVNGIVSKGRLVPVQYEDISTRRSSNVSLSISYEGGSPSRMNRSPPVPVGKPRSPLFRQEGALDILTTTYLLLKDTQASELCDHDFFVFDGIRRSKIVTELSSSVNGEVTCSGRFIRGRRLQA